MKSTLSVMKSVVVAVALVAGVAGVARADDSSMSRFGGDGYAYFHEDKPVVSYAPSEFRNEDPHGLTESQYQTLSSEGPEWQPRASIDKTLPSFRKTDPHGLSISEYEALSSNDSMWQVKSLSILFALDMDPNEVKARSWKLKAVQENRTHCGELTIKP